MRAPEICRHEPAIIHRKLRAERIACELRSIDLTGSEDARSEKDMGRESGLAAPAGREDVTIDDQSTAPKHAEQRPLRLHRQACSGYLFERSEEKIEDHKSRRRSLNRVSRGGIIELREVRILRRQLGARMKYDQDEEMGRDRITPIPLKKPHEASVHAVFSCSRTIIF